MSGKIFINYRRGDDPGNTGRLFREEVYADASEAQGVPEALPAA